MRKLLRKIYNTVVPISRKNFNYTMGMMAKSLEGTTTAIEQQAAMLSNLATHLSEVSDEKLEKPEKKSDTDQDKMYG